MSSMQILSARGGGWRAHPIACRLIACRGLILQIGRYGLVSVAALGCDFAVFLALTKAGTAPFLAGMAGYAVGLALHYLLSTQFVFDTHAARKPAARLFGEFAVSGGAGLILTAAIISIMTRQLHAAPVLAKVTAVIVSFAVVFFLRRTVVFAARQPAAAG